MDDKKLISCFFVQIEGFGQKMEVLLFLFFGFRAGRGGPKQLAMMQLMPMPWKEKKDDSTFA